MTLENVANKVAANMPGKNGAAAAIDPAMIPVIIDIVGNLITLFKGCNKSPAEALKSAHNPSRWERALLNQQIRRELGVGFFKFRREGDDLVEAVMKTGKSMVETDMNELYAEVE